MLNVGPHGGALAADALQVAACTSGPNAVTMIVLPCKPKQQGLGRGPAVRLLVLQDSIYFAYFPPYSYSRHQELIARIHAKGSVRLEVLGETLDGYDLDVLRIGEAQPAALVAMPLS